MKEVRIEQEYDAHAAQLIALICETKIARCLADDVAAVIPDCVCVCVCLSSAEDFTNFAGTSTSRCDDRVCIASSKSHLTGCDLAVLKTWFGSVLCLPTRNNPA